MLLLLSTCVQIIVEIKAILLPAARCRFEHRSHCACSKSDSTNNMAKRRGDWSY